MKGVATVSIKLTPLEDKIIVKQAQAETQTASGLYIPDNAKEKPQQGEVLAVGPGRLSRLQMSWLECVLALLVI